MGMNIMEDASSLRYGCLVHYYCLWCISIHRGYTSNFAEGKWFCQGLFTWREGAQASRLTDVMGKGSFHIILFKSHRFFMTFMPDKCFLKIKIHPMTSPWFHGICRIKVMMNGFLARLYCLNLNLNLNLSIIMSAKSWDDITPTLKC